MRAEPVPACILAALLSLLGACSPAESETAELREGLEFAHPADVGIDSVALHYFLRESARYETDALIIIKDGKLVVERYRQPELQDALFRTESMSQSVLSVVVGAMVHDGTLKLEDNAAGYIREWTQSDGLADITVRDLLSHTSGLNRQRAVTPDGSKLALGEHLAAARSEHAAGATWQYNENAVDAAAWVAELAAEQPLADYARRQIFEPLATEPAVWSTFRDGAPVGADQVQIRPLALAKLGLLLVDQGTTSQGVSIVDEQWLDRISSPASTYAPEHGLLWQRNAPAVSVGMTDDVLEIWRREGVSRSIIEKAQQWVGRSFDSGAAFEFEWRRRLDPSEANELDTRSEDPSFPLYRTISVGPMRGFFSQTASGQALFVYPNQRLVVVRMQSPVRADELGAGASVDRSFPEFVEAAAALVSADG